VRTTVSQMIVCHHTCSAARCSRPQQLARLDFDLCPEVHRKESSRQQSRRCNQGRCKTHLDIDCNARRYWPCSRIDLPRTYRRVLLPEARPSGPPWFPERNVGQGCELGRRIS
jgi:hypothetical protein